MTDRPIAVLDVGKTLSKLSVWHSGGVLADRRVYHNRRRVHGGHGGYDCLDVEGIGEWLIASLKDLAAKHSIAAVIPVAHGAGVAVIRDGVLVAPPLDYEFPIPASSLTAYRETRDSFSETGSPALPDGLNLGAQLHYLETELPGGLDGVELLPWAQYWAWFLSGVARSEVTSLGCHSDLWSPARNDFSPMARNRGWAGKFAPMAYAADVVGHVRSEIAQETGLGPDVAIHCGLHDSNAALVAARGFDALSGCDNTVLSTGTWFVAMRTPQQPVSLGNLPEARDCLVNVDIEGRAIPSGRFMGGREIELLIGIDTRRVDIRRDQKGLLGATQGVVQAGAMVLPTLASGFGPFSHGRGRWLNMPDDWFARRAGACLYAALVADVTLDLIGAQDTLLVEGRFAEAQVFVRALAGLRPEMTVFTANAENDVSFGALRVLDPGLKPEGGISAVKPLRQDLTAYRDEWRQMAERMEIPA